MYAALECVKKVLGQAEIRLPKPALSGTGNEPVAGFAFGVVRL